jgi:phytol kinase
MDTLQATLFSLPVVWHNALITLLTFIYVFSVPPLMDYLVTNHGLPRDISRKITHICAGSVIVFLPLFIDGDWSHNLNITVFAVWTLLLIQKGLFAADDDQAVKTMTRTGDKRELLKGTLYFVLVAMICGTFYYKQPAGILAMAMLGWGDGLAPVIGTRYGRMKYRILSDKSVEGSLAFLVGSIAAGLFFIQLIAPGSLSAGKIIAIAVIATIAEGISPKEVDNLTIPLAVITAVRFL